MAHWQVRPAEWPGSGPGLQKYYDIPVNPLMCLVFLIRYSMHSTTIARQLAVPCKPMHPPAQRPASASPVAGCCGSTRPPAGRPGQTQPQSHPGPQSVLDFKIIYTIWVFCFSLRGRGFMYAHHSSTSSSIVQMHLSCYLSKDAPILKRLTPSKLVLFIREKEHRFSEGHGFFQFLSICLYKTRTHKYRTTGLGKIISGARDTVSNILCPIITYMQIIF